MHDGSSIVHVASDSAYQGSAGLAAYSAATAGVISFARSFSLNLPERNSRVNVLSPGSTDTPVFGKFGLPAEVAAQVKAGFVESIPLKRIGQPREMGRVAVFLASEDSSFMLGSEVLADGGSTMRYA